MKIDTNTILLALLGVLVLMAGVQAIQLVTISQAISGGAVVSASTTGASTGVLSQLSQASQVGGCG
jgi:hypothetical protein